MCMFNVIIYGLKKNLTTKGKKKVSKILSLQIEQMPLVPEVSCLCSLSGCNCSYSRQSCVSSDFLLADSIPYQVNDSHFPTFYPRDFSDMPGAHKSCAPTQTRSYNGWATLNPWVMQAHGYLLTSIPLRIQLWEAFSMLLWNIESLWHNPSPASHTSNLSYTHYIDISSFSVCLTSGPSFLLPTDQLPNKLSAPKSFSRPCFQGVQRW